MRTTVDGLARAVQKQLDDDARSFERSIGRTLNRAAGMTQDKLISQEKRTFRAPVPYTTNPRSYKLTLAWGSQEHSRGFPQYQPASRVCPLAAN